MSRQGSTGSGKVSLVVAYHCQIMKAIMKRPDRISSGRTSGAENDDPAVACWRAVAISRHAPSNRTPPAKSTLLSVFGEKRCQAEIEGCEAEGSVSNCLGMINASRIKAKDPSGTLVAPS